MTIKFKLLLLIIGTLILATIFILTAVNKQFVMAIDKNQHALYNERIDNILGQLDGYEERLKMTGQVEAYSDGFKESAIKALQKTYYQQQNKNIFPFIINHDEEFVMFPNFLAGNLSLAKSDLVSKMLFSSIEKSGSFEFKKRWFSYKRFDSWNWVVVYTVPLEIKYSEVQKLSRILILIMIVITALSIIIMWLAVIRITKPIEVLTKGTRAIAAGNYSSVIDMTGSDEMGKLAGDFNQMAEAVNKKIVALNREIDERQRAEEALRKSELLFSQMFEQSSTSMCFYKPDGTISRVNNEFCKMFGVKEKVIMSAGYNIFSDQAAIDAGIIPLVREIFDKKKRKNWEIDYNIDSASDSTKTPTLKTGKIFLQVFGHPVLNRNGDLESVVLQHYDISKRKQAKAEKKKLEARLQQAQKMESIGTLAGGIAHDFNNLLFPIIGFSEMLKEDLPPDSPEYESAQEIFNAGKRGGALVKQILAFSRQSDHKLQPVRVQKILKEVLKLTRSSIPTDIRIDQNIQKDCGLVMAEPTQLHQVAMNLITNAYHAVEKTSGEISIQLKEIIIDAGELKDSSLQSGRYVMLSVSDNGIGISRRVINNIFDPYFTTKKKGKGTGLGLSVVFGIVKEHKGDIKVYSEEGKGATFNVYLPLMEKFVEAVANDQVSVLQNGTESLLLVDDEKSVVRLEKQILERLGYKVSAQLSSIEALEIFKANPDDYDLVITDMTMPNMTGDKLAKEILSIRSNISIIICTGFSERINKVQAEAIGVKGFLMKPVVKSEMAHMVRKVLDEGKNSDPEL